MINPKIIKKLKQTNITENSEKTKLRVRELWKASSKAQKHAVEETAGISRATVYRVYNTGSISAKLVTPMSQNFNVNPRYLTGQTDIKGECTDEILIEFLTELGYGELLKPEIEKEKRRLMREKAMAAKASAQEQAEMLIPAVKAEDLSLADLHLLLQSLLLKEKAGIPDAVNKAVKLRELLLS